MNKETRIQKIQEIIDAAVASEIDPYLALGILIMEHPPLIGNNFKSYALFYGIIPVDNVAGADLFQCKIAKTPEQLGDSKKVTSVGVQKYRGGFFKSRKNI